MDTITTTSLLLLLVVGGLSLAGLALLSYIRNSRHRLMLEETRLRREEEAAERSRRSSQSTGTGWTAHGWNPDAMPEYSGDYVTLNFDLGAGIGGEEFIDVIRDAVELPNNLAYLHGLPSVEVRVYRANFENPLDLILWIGGGSLVAGQVILLLRQWNDYRNKAKRENAQTEIEESKAKLVVALMDNARDSLGSDSGSFHEARERAESVANILGHDGFRSVTHNEVPIIDRDGNDVPSLDERRRLRELN